MEKLIKLYNEQAEEKVEIIEVQKGYLGTEYELKMGDDEIGSIHDFRKGGLKEDLAFDCGMNEKIQRFYDFIVAQGVELGTYYRD